MTSSAMAQNNPFVPPQSGMSRAQIEQIVRQEVERAKQQGGPSSANPNTPGVPPPANGNNNTPATTPAAAPAKPAEPTVDAVAELMKAGGVFIGCVGGTPVFKDKIGRRAYFTTKELRESNEARRFTRCS